MHAWGKPARRLHDRPTRLLDRFLQAQAYLAHPVLGPRLVECVNALLGHPERDTVQMLGEVDAMKFRSCLTLFAVVAGDEPCFRKALETFYEGQPDEETLRLLEQKPQAGG